MSMHTYVQFGKAVDEKYKKYQKVWETCEAAGVQIPSEVLSFFNDEKPDGRAYWETVKQDYNSGKFSEDAVKQYCEEGEDIFEIDTRKLPPDISLVRVINSY